jgi:phosphatidylserine/phosphatidylglycerophosphate/cardiolipin synthase-like enzyme
VVFSVANLHAKIYAFDKLAFIGSANVSNRSAGTLLEAMIRTTDPTIIRSARAFVRRLCLHELSPGALDRLSKKYKPLRVFGGTKAARRKHRYAIRPELPRLWLVQLKIDEWPDERSLRMKLVAASPNRAASIDAAMYSMIFGGQESADFRRAIRWCKW